MNCNELNKDLERLQELYVKYNDYIEKATESGVGRQATLEARQEFSEQSDDILAKYLPDFAEKFPDWHGWEIGKNIEGFSGDIWNIAPLPDERVLVGGYNGELRILSETDGELKLSEIIEGFKGYVRAIAPLPDGRVLIGGVFGELRFLSETSPSLQNLKQAISDGKITAR